MEKTVHRPGTPVICDRSERAAGFTLVEISIVLVIIGLLVGAIVVGHEMIQAAQIRAEASLYQQYNTATNAFRMKYNALPGDFANATQYFTPTASITVVNGDGNGEVFPLSNPGNIGAIRPCGNTEGGQFFSQLYLAGLSDYAPSHLPSGCTSPDTIPYSRIKGRFMVYAEVISGTSTGWSGQTLTITGGVNHYYLNGIVLAPANSDSVDGMSQARTANVSYHLDAKIDDGLPTTGKVRVACSDSVHPNPTWEDTPGGLCRGPNLGNPCVTAAGFYNVKSGANDCGLKVQAGF